MLPQYLDLKAMNEFWTVETLASSGKLQLLTRPDNSLVLHGNLSSKKACREKLKNWVTLKAKEYLVPCVNNLIIETGLNISKLTIRSQKTRWGSCSSKASISLNYKLVFLPEKLAKYIVIHELCHIKHFDHSKQFWALVEQFEPQYKECRKLLNKISLHVSDWGLISEHSEHILL